MTGIGHFTSVTKLFGASVFSNHYQLCHTVIWNEVQQDYLISTDVWECVDALQHWPQMGLLELASRTRMSWGNTHVSVSASGESIITLHYFILFAECLFLFLGYGCSKSCIQFGIKCNTLRAFCMFVYMTTAGVFFKVKFFF